jgi:hypothetical protein
MSRIVDLMLPVTSNMAGIPKIAFYEQYPTRIQAVTVVNEEQRVTLLAEGVDCLPNTPAIKSMNTVITLNTHIGTAHRCAAALPCRWHIGERHPARPHRDARGRRP